MRASPLMFAIALSLGLPANHVAEAASVDSHEIDKDSRLQTYLVMFDEAPLASFTGFGSRETNRPHLAATSPAATGAAHLDVHSPDSVAYRNYLADMRRIRLSDASARVGRQLQPSFVYDVASNGMAVDLTGAEARVLAQMPGIRSVHPSYKRYPMTDRGPLWIKADKIWTGAVSGVTARRGENIVVGVIDSGVNAGHPSFAATVPGGGYTHSNPRGSTFYGICAAGSHAPCNTKLIGVWDKTTGAGDNETNTGLDNTPTTGSNGTLGPCVNSDGVNECVGHGTHTASTAVGNPLSVVIDGSTVTMSGVAQRANLITYKACEAKSSCQITWILAAIDQAVADQVDTINYSIGSGPVDPWATVSSSTDRDDSEAFLAARSANIVVAAAAGNDGPDPGTLGSPSNAPWVISVAAASHDRPVQLVTNRVFLTGGTGPLPGGGTLTGSGNTNISSGTASVALARDLSHPFCAEGSNPGTSPPTGVTKPASWTATTFSGKIVVCERATQNSVGYARVEMAYNVQQAGGVGMILLNQSSDGDSTVSDAYVVPTVHLGYNDSQSVRTWLSSGSGQKGQIEGSQVTPTPLPDRLALFSGRGPVIPTGILKPDITAPGGGEDNTHGDFSGIYAAGLGTSCTTFPLSGTCINELWGTSMATPHITGAAALLKSVHTSWTASQIISALDLTARPSVVVEGGSLGTPHDQGAGMADVSKAVLAGLFLNVTNTQFTNGSSAPQNLNLPSLVNDHCFESCSLTRTVTDMTGGGSWLVQSSLPTGLTVTPSIGSFSVGNGGSQSIAFNFTVSPSLAGRWVYGSVTLKNNGGSNSPDLVLPVAIHADAGAVPAGITPSGVSLERGFADASMSGLVAMPNARYVTTDLVTPVVNAPSLKKDSTGSDPYDKFGTANGAFFYTFTIPASPPSGTVTYRVHASTSSVAQDVDLYVGEDLNQDGLPSASEQVCGSLGSTATETCQFDVATDSAAHTYWVVAQNFKSKTATSTDVVNIESYAVPLTAGTRGTLTVTGPGHTASSASFGIRVGWDDATFMNGETRIGYLLLQAIAGSTAAEIPVRLVRSGSGFAPFVLAPSVARSVTLAPAAFHDKLVFDIPPHATSVTFSTAGSSGSVRLDASFQASPTGPAIATAPVTNDASSAVAGANQTITLTGAALKAGRWYLKPQNTGVSNATVAVTATINSVGTPPAFESGQYYDTARSGHGAFVDFAGDQWVMVWYTYLQDGTPTWYYSQGPAATSNGIWRGDLFRVVWNGSATSGTDIGEVVITETGAKTLTYSYNLDGQSGSEHMDRLGGGGCPTYNSQPLDVTGHWYSPDKSGFGYSYQDEPGTEILAGYVYDSVGFPRWLYGQKAFDSNVDTFSMYQLTGFCPLCSFLPTTNVAVGTGTRTLATNNITNMSINATFTGALSGTWSENRPVAMLSARKNCQ